MSRLFPPDRIRGLQEQFLRVLNGRANSSTFAADAAEELTEGTIAAERDLVANADRIIAIYEQLPVSHRQAIARCIERMCTEMPDFHTNGAHVRLNHMRELNRYCYVVAGVVGEMLTDLFCEHSTAVLLPIAPR